MKYKVKFRISGPDSKKHKFAMNLEAEAVFRLGDERPQLGLSGVPEGEPRAELLVRDGVLHVRAASGSGLELNNQPLTEGAVKVGDFLQLGRFTYEILDAPHAPIPETSTRFVDVDELRAELKGLPKSSRAPTPSSKAPANLSADLPPSDSSHSGAERAAPARSLEGSGSSEDGASVEPSHTDLPGRPTLPQKSAETSAEKSSAEKSYDPFEPSAFELERSRSSGATSRPTPRARALPPAERGDTLVFLAERQKRMQRWGIGAAVAGVLIAVWFGSGRSKPEETVVDLQAGLPAGATSALETPAPTTNVPVTPSVAADVPPVPLQAPPAAAVAVATPTPAPVATPSEDASAVQGFAPVPKVQDPFAVEQFYRAVKTGNLKVVKTLVESGAVDPTFALEKGSTPLMFAAASGHSAIVRYLLTKRLSINAKDPSGTTALMWAVYRGHRDVARILLNAGADATLKRDDGDTALDIAKRWGKYDVAELLEKHASKSGERGLASPKRGAKSKRPSALPKKLRRVPRE